MKEKIEFEGILGDRDEAGMTYLLIGKPYYKDTFYGFIPTKFTKGLRKGDRVKITIEKVE